MRASRPRRRPRAPDGAMSAFDRIRADRRHGARALALEALRDLRELLEGWARRPAHELRPAFRQVARALEDAQPAMGPFLRWAGDWRQMARSNVGWNMVGTAQTWVRRERARIWAETPRLVRTSRQRFPRAAHYVVTLSRSQTVLVALRALPRASRPERVTVLESLPGGEGCLFAQDLRRHGIAASVVPDRAGVAAARAADLVIVGADAVFSDGSVAHKVGTRGLAQAASRSGVPVVVVAGRSKFTGRPAPRRRLPARFDRTPPQYITEYWTDGGARAGRARPRKRPHRPPL